MALLAYRTPPPPPRCVVAPTNQQRVEHGRHGAGRDGQLVWIASRLPAGALELTTDLTTTAKAQYLHAANVRWHRRQELGY